MCYCTVGWFPPEPPWLHRSVTCNKNKTKKTTTPCFTEETVAKRTHAVVKFIDSLSPDHMRPWLGLLLSPRSSPGRAWVCSITSCIPSLTFALLKSRLAVDKEKASPACWTPPVQLSSPRLILPRRGAAVQPPSTFILRYYCSAHTRLALSHTHHAFTRRLLCEHPLPSSLVPSSPPSHPAAAGRPDSHRIPIIL